jgi:molybdate transport system ATP-binding protein
MIARSSPDDLSALNVLLGIVVDLGSRDSSIVEIKLDCNGDALIARLTRFSVERLGIRRGERVHAMVKSVALDRRSLIGPIESASSADAEVSAG